MNPEREIIKGLKAGQDEAYRYLYEQQYKMLCIVACEYVKDALVAEIIVSDVIFAIWKSRESLEINVSLRNYLIRAVCNRCLNYLAQSQRQNTLREHVGKNIETEQTNYENNPDNPLTQLIEKELDAKINECIETLPAQTRRIFCLSRFDNLKYDEIAHETGVSVDVVKYHIKSALVRLKDELKGYLITLIIFLINF